MDIFALVVGCFALGLIARNLEPKTVQFASVINRLIIYVFFPSVVLSTAPDIVLNQSAIFVFASPWVIGFLLFIPFCLWLSRRLQLSHQEEGVLILLSILGNTAFLGIAMVRSLLGEDSVPQAILYDQMGSFMILAILGAIVIAIYSPNNVHRQNGGKQPAETKRMPPVSSIVKNIICFPPFLALMLSFFIPSTESMGALLPVLKLIGSAIVPMALIVIGLQIELKVEKRHRGVLLAILGLKMLILPALTLAAAFLLGISSLQLKTSVLQAAMPPMVTPAIMLIEARIAPKLTASVLGIGTLAAFIALPAWAYLLNQFF